MTLIDDIKPYVEAYGTKWYVILVGAVITYVLLDSINTKRLMKKLGAEHFTNDEGDGCNGFHIARQLYVAKSNGTVNDFALSRYADNTVPSVPTFRFPLLGMKVVVTRDPENLKAILATQFNDFALGLRHKQLHPVLGDGIFTLDGEGWKQSRAMLRPQFAREQVGHVQSLEPHIQFLARHIKIHKGKQFDIQELFFRFTLDASTEFLFGESVGSLQTKEIGAYNPETVEGAEEFTEAFNVVQVYLANRALLQGFYWMYNFPDFRRRTAQVHKFANLLVKQALNMSPEELDKKSKGGYIFLYELCKQTRSHDVLRDQLLNILIAGRDTTAGLLSFTFYELARNPDIWAKLKAEVYEKFGSGDDVRLEDITFESLKKCEYLKAVLNESLRMYPSVPQNFRVATRNTTLPRGGGKDGMSPILIKKGTNVMYSVYATHRDETHYGKDAAVYRPERWFEPSTKKLGWAFLPFNGGPRICLGQQFALTEASYVIVRLAQLFPNIASFDSDEYPPRKASHLTVSLQYGSNISLA